MKFKVKLLSVLLAAVLLLPLIPVGSVSAEGGQASYTKNKIVSVLFDNSGSMKNDGGTVYRWEYAKYALQTLMTTLGKNDKLIITPMNKTGSTAKVEEYTDPSVIEVNLSAEDREAEIQRVINASFFAQAPTGQTPPKGIEVAVDQLVHRFGMKLTSEVAADEESENEYFLVVLTDGAFTGIGGDKNKTAALFEADLSKYASFQSIYIGFDVNALDLSDAPSLQNKANFTAYKAANTSEIGGVMQSVANRITGRYPLKLNVDPNSKTVRIPLSDVDFSLRTVTVMATNTNARPDASILPTYNGVPVSVSQEAAFDSPVNEMKGGFTTVLSRGTSATFSGGELVLTLDEAPGANAVISVLLEPALSLEPVIEVNDGGTRKAVDAAYINSHMKKGDTVYLSYRIVEQDTGKVIDPSAIGGTSSARVTYDTKSYAPGEAVTLVEGKKEIGISVSMLDGQYTLYASFPCVVLENPSFFRIESGDVEIPNTTTYKTTFSVYSNNQKITSLSALEAFRPTVSVTAEDGSAVTSYRVDKNADGTFTVTLDVSGKEYGTYTVNASVKDTEGNPREIDVPIGYYPSGLTLTSTGESKISCSLHEILANGKSVRFELTAQETKIPFNNALLTYRLTVGGVDVTKDTVIDGNVLTYVPTAASLGALAEKTGEHDILLTATFRGAKVETVECKLEKALALTDTVFEVVPLAPTGSVDRFALKKNQSTISFKVLRDGVPLSEEELKAALDDGTLYLDHSAYKSFLSPVRANLTVESVGDTPVLTVLPTGGQFFLLRGLVTSMLVFGDGLDMDVHYGSVNAVGTIGLAKAGIVSYILRILLILYIIQLIILALTFNKVKRIPKGVFVRVPIVDYEKDETELKGKVIVVKRVGAIEYLVLKRLLPYVGLCFWSKDIATSEGTLKYHQNAGVCVPAGIKCLEGELKPSGAIVASTLKGKGWAALKPGASFSFNKAALAVVSVKITPKTAKASIDQPLTGTRGLILKTKFYLFVSARAVGKYK